MRRLSHGLAVLAVGLWAGCLWAIGYLAVPVLFHALPDRMLAGMLAGQMFTGVAYAGLACGFYLLLYGYSLYGNKLYMQKAYWLVILMLLLTLIGQFGLQPVMADIKVQALPLEVMQSEFAGRFRLLHGVAGVLYLSQSLLAAILVLKFATSDRSPPSA